MAKITINNAHNSVVVGGSIKNSRVVTGNRSQQTLFDDLDELALTVTDRRLRQQLEELITAMRSSQNTPVFASHYKRFAAMAADHVTLLSPFVAGLAAYLS